MFHIDNKRVEGDTANMLLSNISEKLSEIISLLKPQEVKEEGKFKCGCGKSFENERQLRGHQIKCKSKG